MTSAIVRAEKLRRPYAERRNIMAWLRERQITSDNDPGIIRASYDMQADSYVAVLQDPRIPEEQRRAAGKFVELFDRLGVTSILEAGTGERTTLHPALDKMSKRPNLSRLGVGRAYWRKRGQPDVGVVHSDAANNPIARQLSRCSVQFSCD